MLLFSFFFVNHWSFFFFTAKHLYIFFSYQKQIFQKHIFFSQIFHTIFISDSCFQHLVTFCNSFDFLLHRKTFAYLSHYQKHIFFSQIFHTIFISYTFILPFLKSKFSHISLNSFFLFSYWIILLHIIIKKSTIFFFKLLFIPLQETQLIFIYRIVQKLFHPQLSLSLYSLQF